MPKSCLHCYIGTKGFLAHKRFLEHSAAVRNGVLKNAVAKHDRLHHNPDGGDYRGEILEGSIKFNLERFVTEAVRIQKAKDDPEITLMNQKGEWGHYGITRVQVINER